MIEDKRLRFSVIIPVRDGAATIERCLDSVLDQAFGSFEVVVVDDGSSDRTLEVIANYGDRRLRAIGQEHLGVSAARNHGVRSSIGRFLTFLDSDDEALPGWLQSFDAALASVSCAAVCCGVDDVTDGFHRVRQPTALGPAFADAIGLFLPGSYAVRRRVFNEIGGFAAELRYGEHHELGMRLTSYCRSRSLSMACLQEPLVVRHRDRDSRGRAKSYRQARYESVMYLLKNHEEQMGRSPTWLANHLAVAGVSALGMGRSAEGRRLLRRAIRLQPRELRNYVRYAISLAPSLARRRW
jgi:glycosyltransferase involved in cell wall biosynthesis